MNTTSTFHSACEQHRQVLNSSSTYLTEKGRHECGAVRAAGLHPHTLWAVHGPTHPRPPGPGPGPHAPRSPLSSATGTSRMFSLRSTSECGRVSAGGEPGQRRCRPARPRGPPGRPSLTEVAQQSDLAAVPGQRQSVVLHPRAAAHVPQHGHAHPARAARPPPPPQQQKQQSRHRARHRRPQPRPQARPRRRHL